MHRLEEFRNTGKITKIYELKMKKNIFDTTIKQYC